MSGNQSYNERELLLKIVAGDELAFAEIFRQYFHHIYLLMLKYTNRHSDAEDIVQQVFANLWEKRHLLSGVEKLDKWLFTVALNEFRMRFRKNRLSDQYREYLSEVFDEAYGAPDEMLMGKQKRALVKKALDRLPPKQRQAFSLSREEGLTYAEIGREMGIDPTTVKEHISRATKAIRTFVMEGGGEFLLFMILFSSFF